MKVANEMASMLEAFHKGFVHGGVNSETILVAESKSPVVYDFGSFTYIKNRERCEEFVQKLYYFHLIRKHKYRELVVPVAIWSEDEILNYDLQKSAVDYSFYVDEQVALCLTKLAIDCLKVNLDEQPTTIGDSLRELKDLMLRSAPNKLLQKISS